MSRLLGPLFENSPLMLLPLLALVLFGMAFLTTVARVYGRSARSYEPVARRPLDDDGDDR